ncbi:sigma-70 family RNA polymerase sigma factor [Singulisphaera sp. Ch08]|uniref:Sigma-70 family RNA polymerase sigma factor n=1 Tax=Singulisphaera sp. Ch08 TaxID=3120278 RepID=A0AAU7CHA8_9BACT
MSETDTLIQLACQGDEVAREQLLTCFRGRLRQMVAVRLDPRLAARFDPSDVVQEALLDAARNLTAYLAEPPLPFYPWLRQFAWNRLVELHRHHLLAQRRSVTCEQVGRLPLPDESTAYLANHLLDSGTSPSQGLIRDEMIQRVRDVLAAMAVHDQEVIALRYLEQLSVSEIAAVLGVSEGAVKSRHMRALLRLRVLLDGAHSESS